MTHPGARARLRRFCARCAGGFAFTGSRSRSKTGVLPPAPYLGSFIRPRLVSLGLPLNRTLVGVAGGGLVVSALLARVCGRCPSPGVFPARAAPEYLASSSGPERCSLGALGPQRPLQTPKSRFTREPMVHGPRVGQRLGFFVVQRLRDETVVRDNISRKSRRMVPSRNTCVLSGVSGADAETLPRGGALVGEHGR